MLSACFMLLVAQVEPAGVGETFSPAPPILAPAEEKIPAQTAHELPHPRFEPPVLLPNEVLPSERETQNPSFRGTEGSEEQREEKARLSAQLEQLDELLEDMDAELQPASFTCGEEEAQPSSERKESEEDHQAEEPSVSAFEGAAVTILALKSHARVAGAYVRVMNVVDFVEDPEGIEPFLGAIIICPAPDIGGYLTVSRALIRNRLKQYGIPLDKIVLTGAPEVLVLRIKAQAPQEKEPEGEKQPSGVQKDQPVRIVRAGRFFRIEEWGEALRAAKVGEILMVKDRKGRLFRARVTGPDTVVPVEEESSGAREERE